MNTRWKKATCVLCLGTIALIAGTTAINLSILKQSRSQIFSDPASIPANEVALVLGASPTLHSGTRANPFFDGRMNAAAALFRAGKAQHFLLSGDNSRREYDEPTAMRAELIKRGIPDRAMTLDYAGFRTLDSVARARSVFGQNRVTIVTDDFHISRALFLAKSQGVEAIGFTSEPVPQALSRKTRLREIAARMGAWLDVFIFHTEPKFEGPAVAIRVTQS